MPFFQVSLKSRKSLPVSFKGFGRNAQVAEDFPGGRRFVGGPKCAKGSREAVGGRACQFAHSEGKLIACSSAHWDLGCRGSRDQAQRGDRRYEGLQGVVTFS